MNTRKILADLSRWTARVAGTLLVIVTVAIAIGEKMPNPLKQPMWGQIICLALAVIMAGILAGWRWELAGGLLSLAGFGFGIIPLGHSPRGLTWFYFALAVPGALYVASALLRRTHPLNNLKHAGLIILIVPVLMVQGCGKPMRTVGIDLQHGGDWPGLADTLVSNGYKVVPIKHSIDAATLKKTGVLIVLAPTKPYADAEVQAIVGFVKKGGGLLCAGQAWSWTYKEYGNQPIETYPLNVLGKHLDFTVTAENAGTPTYLDTEIMTGIERVERTDWWPSKVEITATNGQTIVQDQNRTSIGGRFTVGNGRIVVYGSSALLRDNPKVLLKTVSYLKGRP